MKRYTKIFFALLSVLLILTASVLPAFAEDAAEPAVVDNSVSIKAIAAAAIIGVAASVGAVAMMLAIRKAVDGTARQPEAAGGIRTTMLMGLVFIETAIIYALIVAVLVIFVL